MRGDLATDEARIYTDGKRDEKTDKNFNFNLNLNLVFIRVHPCPIRGWFSLCGKPEAIGGY